MLTKNNSQEIPINFVADNAIENNVDADLTGISTNMIFTNTSPANESLKRKNDENVKVNSVAVFLAIRSNFSGV